MTTRKFSAVVVFGSRNPIINCGMQTHTTLLHNNHATYDENSKLEERGFVGFFLAKIFTEKCEKTIEKLTLQRAAFHRIKKKL